MFISTIMRLWVWFSEIKVHKVLNVVNKGSSTCSVDHLINKGRKGAENNKVTLIYSSRSLNNNNTTRTRL